MFGVIEYDWVTSSGLRAVCILVADGSHRCGYVSVSSSHPNYEIGYNDVVADVHGGLTYGGRLLQYEAFINDDLWWFGFDCAHYNDIVLSMLTFGEEVGEGRVFRSAEFVIAECEKLATYINKEYKNES